MSEYVRDQRMRAFKLVSTGLVCLLGRLILGDAAWGQEGFSIEDDAAIIESEDHWARWQSVAKTIQITEEGVKPAFIRKSTKLEVDGVEQVVPGINAVLNASEFGGGIWDAGSNRLSAENLMDGRMDTYWEPDTSTPLRDWWVQIDLGRAVSANKIVLKFVGEDLGDPFLQFKVLTSQGETIIGPLVYRKRFSTNKPIKNERVFEVDLTNQLPTKWTTGARGFYRRCDQIRLSRRHGQRLWQGKTSFPVRLR